MIVSRVALVVLLGATAACAAADPPPEPSAPRIEAAPAAASECRALYDRVVMAYRRLADIRARGDDTSSATYLAMGDVMDRLDASLAAMRPDRDDVKLLVDEYRTAARAMAVASRETGRVLAQAEGAKAKLSSGGGPRALPSIVDRMVARCRQTHDDDCRRVAAPLRALGEGSPSSSRILAARADLDAIAPKDPELRGSVDAIRETLAEMASLVRTAEELEGEGRARVDAFARAAHGFSGLQTQATAACGAEIGAAAIR